MLSIIVLAAVGFLALALLLARYATNPRVARARLTARSDGARARPRIAAARLRVIVGELFEAMGVTVERTIGDDQRLIGVRHDPLCDLRYVVFLEAAPAADVVEAPTLLELIEQVKCEHASVGLVISPYEISAEGLSGFEAPIELIDGARLRRLIAEHLPARLAEIDAFHGFPAPRVAGNLANEAPAATPGDKRTATNDSVRDDGGESTEDQPVTTEQSEHIAHSALDHTADEAGS